MPLKKSVFTTLNSAALGPVAKPRDSTATAVITEFLTKSRKAKRMS